MRVSQHQGPLITGTAVIVFAEGDKGGRVLEKHTNLMFLISIFPGCFLPRPPSWTVQL